jgi:hypothetical protein
LSLCRRALAIMPLVTLAILLVVSPASARKHRFEGVDATVSTTIHAGAEDVYKALTEALREWKMRKSSLDERIVKTSWIQQERGRELFRDRVVAEFAEEGYLTHLTVRHERQRKMKEMKQTVSGPTASWRKWDGDHALCRAIIGSVEEALGQKPATVDLTSLAGRPAAATPTIIREYIVPPHVAGQVNTLKAKRRDLVKEVKAMDSKILAAVYDGKYEQIKDDVERWKARKAAFESQIARIDQDILALILAEDT